MRDDSCEAMDNTDVREIERLRSSDMTVPYESVESAGTSIAGKSQKRQFKA